MAMKDRKTTPTPVSLDDQLLAEIDSVAVSVKETRSAVMRAAIRKGLPLVKAGRAADVITLDSEISKEIDHFAAETKASRPKVLIEAIRQGLPLLKPGGIGKC